MSNYSFRVRVGSLCLLALLLFAPGAWAHAVLVRSVPDAHALLPGPVISVTLEFNSRIDGKRSRISLVTPNGQLYTLDIAPQTTPQTLIAPAKDLTSGEYKIRWQVIAADGHITRGEVPFRIK